MYLFLGLRFRRSGAETRLLTRIRELCSRYIPPAYSHHALAWHDASAQLAWLAWPKLRTAAGDPRETRHKLLFNGYVTSRSGGNLEDQIAALLSRDGDHLTLQESTGGVAAFCYPDLARGRLYAWTTQPPAIGLYWATDDDYFVVSTRPLLCQIAARRSDFFRPHSDYAAVHLVSDCGLDGSTPYEAVRRLSANRALCLSAEGVQEVAHPLRVSASSMFSPRTTEHEKAEALADALVRAVRPLTESPSAVLMSGGKDSRLVAAAVTAAGGSPTGITFGPMDGAETAVARQVADTLHIPIDVRRQPAYADPIEAACRSHMRTEGLVLSVPHQIRFAEPLYSELPVGHGHGHLARGGFADRIEDDVEKVRKKIFSPFITGWVKPEFGNPNKAVVERAVEARGVSDVRADAARSLEALYWVNHDLRLGPWSSPGQLEYDGLNRMCYPFLDEKVVQIANSLTMADKVSERVVFLAMRKLAPGLVDVPLFRNTWRFELEGEVPGFEGRERRVYRDPEVQASGPGMRYFGEMDRHPNFEREVAEFILSSAKYDHVLRPMLTPPVVEQIEAFAAGQGETEFTKRLHQAARGTLRRMVLHVFALCTLYECSWLRPTGDRNGQSSASATA